MEDVKPPLPEKNEFISFNLSYNNADSLVAIFKWNEKDIVFSYYGSRNSVGEIEKIKSVSIFRKSNTDTVHNYLLNDSMQVNVYYKTVKNIKDSLITKYDYIDTTAIVSIYRINWQTNDFKLREQACINRNSLLVRNITGLKVNGIEGAGSIVQLATSAALTAGGILLVYGGAAIFVAGSPVLAVAGGTIGIFATMTGLNGLYQFSLSQLNNLLYLLSQAIQSAEASELDDLPTSYFPNPNPQFPGFNNLTSLTIQITNPSAYPITQPSISGCYGYVIFNFTCSESNWNAGLQAPSFVARDGSTKTINGAYLTGISNNWGFASNTCSSTGPTAVSFYDISISNGVVSGKGKVLGDVGTCTPPYIDQYFTSFRFALVYSTLTGIMQINTTGTYEIGSNFLYTHQ